MDSSDEEENKNADQQVPIGFDYTENFPSLPDFDGKGQRMKQAAERRQRLQADGGNWGNPTNQEHNFVTNHAREVKPLNDIKARYKQLSNTVLQDLYNIFRDVNMVEEILVMTFPMFRDQAVNLGKMFSKPAQSSKPASAMAR